MRSKLQRKLESLRAKALVWLTPQPEVKEEYVDKVVMLLRRDFDHKEQNEIILSIAKKLDKAREEDMAKMGKAYADLRDAKQDFAHSFKFA